MVLSLLKNQRVWRHLGWRDLRIQYGRSRLGPLWSVATLTTSVAGLVLAQGILIGEIDFFSAAPKLAVALWIWYYFSSITSESVLVFDMERRTLINSVIDESVFVAKVIWKHLVTMLLSVPVLVLLLISIPTAKPIGLLFIAPFLLTFSVALLLPVTVLARFTVMWPDLKGITPPFIQLLFFFSPIIWTPSESLPLSEAIVRLNPIAWLILTAQRLTETAPERYSYGFEITWFALTSLLLYVVFLKRNSSIKGRL